MKKKNQLPDKPSELILLALGDLKKIERSKKYKVDMSVWHEPNYICKVCFAGSVMAKTLNADRTLDYQCGNLGFNDNTVAKLYALNDFRSGYIYDGLTFMKKKSYKKLFPETISVAQYKENPIQFKRDMAEMAKLFQNKGL